jgi:hypothetical protein
MPAKTNKALEGQINALTGAINHLNHAVKKEGVKPKTAKRKIKKEKARVNKNVQAFQNATPSYSNAVSIPMSKHQQKPSREDYSKLSRILGYESIPAFNFVCSPMDSAPATGWPEASMEKSVVQHLQGSWTFTCPPTWTGTYSAAILTMPSVDYPAAVLLSQTGQFNWTSLSSTAAITGNLPYNEGVPTNYSQGSTTSTAFFLTWPNRQYVPARGKPGNYTAGTWASQSPGCLGILSNYNNGGGGSVGTGYISYAVGLKSKFSDSAVGWRCLGQAMTTDLVANALSDQGIVYTRPLSRAINLRTSSHTIYALAENGTVLTSVGQVPVSAATYLVEDVPTSGAAMVGAERTYKGPAKMGSTVISRLSGTPAGYVNADADLASICFQSESSGTSDALAYNAALALANIYTNQGANTTPVNTFVNMVTSIDPNFTPTLTIYEGLACGGTTTASASVTAQISMGVEVVPDPTSELAIVSTTCIPSSSMFAPITQGTMRKIPPGFPAHENWEWTDIAGWIKTGLEVVALVAPFLLAAL